jgi:hypothetical protein
MAGINAKDGKANARELEANSTLEIRAPECSPVCENGVWGGGRMRVRRPRSGAAVAEE